MLMITRTPRHIFLVLFTALLAMPLFVFSAGAGATADDTAGRIVLQVERGGEAWYVDPRSGARHHLGRPRDAFAVMGGLGLGIAHEELNGYLAAAFPPRLSGHILLDVEQNGEAYYVAPDSSRATYLGRPADAFAVMRNEGLGITDADLLKIPIAKGFSEQGRAIPGYDLGDGAYCIVLLATIHGGREFGGTDLLRRLMAEITEDVGAVHASKRVIAFPVVNPDGLATRDDKLNANDVNLNRNFMTSAWAVGEAGTTTYAGAMPFSEAESRAVQAAAGECTDGAMVSFHARGPFVNPEASARSSALARWYETRSGYDVVRGWHYAGTATRWFEEVIGGAAVTVEMTDYGANDLRMNHDALRELITTDVRF